MAQRGEHRKTCVEPLRRSPLPGFDHGIAALQVCVIDANEVQRYSIPRPDRFVAYSV